jgi:hypothetical protein
MVDANMQARITEWRRAGDETVKKPRMLRAPEYAPRGVEQ